jgi:hypothetical protein
LAVVTAQGTSGQNPGAATDDLLVDRLFQTIDTCLRHAELHLILLFRWTIDVFSAAMQMSRYGTPKEGPYPRILSLIAWATIVWVQINGIVLVNRTFSKIIIEKLQERLWIAKLNGIPLKIGTEKDKVRDEARFIVAFGNGLLTASLRATANRLKRLAIPSLPQDTA